MDNSFREAALCTREALAAMKKYADIFDPDADYSDEQIMIIAAQILGGIMPSIETAIEALDGLGET
jgi:hypothetical protein